MDLDQKKTAAFCICSRLKSDTCKFQTLSDIANLQLQTLNISNKHGATMLERSKLHSTWSTGKTESLLSAEAKFMYSKYILLEYSWVEVQFLLCREPMM